MPTPAPVEVRRESVDLPTYEPRRPDRNPMFLEKRVYQGSSGRVYPLPFTDRIAEKPRRRAWDAVFIENDYLLVMILPQLGGRIHRAQDKTNGYDFIYYQPVIKPALVGLAGPWASGGIEFNWPQHHRPSTFMPTDVAVEKHPDGSATVWLGEHDPMARMKGMHGVRLHPGKSYLELVGRAYNRTTDVQSFLWWANVATRVHEQYQSFFPPDATHVADHAKRATSTFPLCQGNYYGVDYGSRARTGVPTAEVPRQYPAPYAGSGRSSAGSGHDCKPNDLSWYTNIPVPTSYMCMGSHEDFAGGYDYKANAGLVQIANHHISPGKKQWTWGNHEFGYSWDRNLTDPDENGEHRPYIELMSGVYTDNQPDFSFLQPGETKMWSQYWYPIRSIGAAQKASLDAAVSLRMNRGIVHVGVAVTSVFPEATVRLRRAGRIEGEWIQTLAPDRPLAFETTIDPLAVTSELSLEIVDASGQTVIRYSPQVRREVPAPPPATEPAPPRKVAGIDELFLTGLHLEQYRHATRSPESYWREALRRDPGESRCHLALGRWHLRRGEFSVAEKHLRASIARLTRLNSNPYDGEAYYQLGLCLVQQSMAGGPDREAKLNDAYDSFYKATWNHAWQPAGFHALGEIDMARGNWSDALDHLRRALRVNADNLRARDLLAVALQKLGREADAAAQVRETLALDPLDWWARALAEGKLNCDWQVRLDLALDCARAGLFAEGLWMLEESNAASSFAKGKRGTPPVNLPDASLGTKPLVHYYRAWLCHQLGDQKSARRHLAAAARATPDYCFPARLEEIAILRHAIAANPADARAPFYLGNLLYDRRRRAEAIALWESSVKLAPDNSIAWRNLGIAYFNIRKRPADARAAYDRALRLAPQDARLLFERDQLWKRCGDSPAARLREMRARPDLVQRRDDLAVELCALLNQTGCSREALVAVSGRKFQPWEGGEGQALGQHVRTHLLLGKSAQRNRNPALASEHYRLALTAPENLGEARHLLANQSDIHYLLGCALADQSQVEAARTHWLVAASFKGDFQAMRVQAYSGMTYFSALALIRLGKRKEAGALLRGLLRHAQKLARTTARIDYFATSLPTMLLFDDDLQARQQTAALFLEAQARLGLGQSAAGSRLLREVLRRDPSHPGAADLAAEQLGRKPTARTART